MLYGLTAKDNAALINVTIEKDVVQSFLDSLSEFALGSTTLPAEIQLSLGSPQALQHAV